MRKLIKFGIYSVVIIIVLVTVIILYWHREQEINFSLVIPQSITYCEREITNKNIEYLELTTWLEKNKTGWVNSLVSFVPITIYRASNISINVMGTAVVVNYSVNGKDWSQVINNKLENELSTSCETANK